jgi:hypothetical protein
VSHDCDISEWESAIQIALFRTKATSRASRDRVVWGGKFIGDSLDAKSRAYIGGGSIDASPRRLLHLFLPERSQANAPLDSFEIGVAICD